MNSSTPEAPKKHQAPSFLLMGPPGGGKTTLAMQFPRPAFIDCDENLDGPERFNRKINKLLSYEYQQVRYKDDKTMREIHEMQDAVLAELAALKARGKWCVPVIDSLTAINEFIIRRHLKKRNRLDGCMEARDWQPFKSDFYFLIMAKLRSMGWPTICIVHEQKVYDAPSPANMMNPGIREYEPTVQGKIQEYFGAFFTDVWRCYSEPEPGNKQSFIIDSQKKPITPMLKNSFGMPSRIVVKEGDNAFLAVNKYMQLSPPADVNPPALANGPQAPSTPAVKP